MRGITRAWPQQSCSLLTNRGRLPTSGVYGLGLRTFFRLSKSMTENWDWETEFRLQ
jgi:hypothetical protein